jgi:hypothetical protein
MDHQSNGQSQTCAETDSSQPQVPSSVPSADRHHAVEAAYSGRRGVLQEELRMPRHRSKRQKLAVQSTRWDDMSVASPRQQLSTANNEPHLRRGHNRRRLANAQAWLHAVIEFSTSMGCDPGRPPDPTEVATPTHIPLTDIPRASLLQQTSS